MFENSILSLIMTFKSVMEISCSTPCLCDLCYNDYYAFYLGWFEEGKTGCEIYNNSRLNASCIMVSRLGLREI